MKNSRLSLFSVSLRAFCIGLFGLSGAAVGILAVILGFGSLFYFAEEESFSSNVTLLPDDQGSRKELGSSSPVILQINLKGEIGKENLKGSKVENLLLKSREDDFKEGRVKGILVVINSPGGDAIDSDVIYRELKQYKERYHVPIYAYVDGMCASGGYYIACAADKIMASDVSLIGSIGVLAWPPFINLADLMQKMGVNALTLSAGIGKDEMNPLRSWKVDEQKNYQELIDFYYTSFVGIVTTNRPKIEKEKLIKEFGARVVPAEQAVTIGLIDGTSYTLSKALKELSLASGIKEGEKYQVVTIETQEWLKRLFREKSFIFTGKIRHILELPQELQLQANHPMKYIYTH
jgi:protease-4